MLFGRAKNARYSSDGASTTSSGLASAGVTRTPYLPIP
jgi:hypothetical protein